MNLLKALESGLDKDKELASEIHEAKILKQKNMEEMLRMCINDGAFDLVLLNVRKIKSMLNRNHRI